MELFNVLMKVAGFSSLPTPAEEAMARCFGHLPEYELLQMKDRGFPISDRVIIKARLWAMMGY